MLALSIAEGFARGWACLHAPQSPAPKNPAAKPRVSITSKLIEIKALQPGLYTSRKARRIIHGYVE